MGKKLLTESTESFPDRFWKHPAKEDFLATPSPASLNKKRNHSSLQEFLHPVDETPDFHDPFSSLSLFLSSHIKKQIQKTGSHQAWTLRLQEELLSSITPEFQKKFPQYRLGVIAVKKIWEKLTSYMQQIQGKAEAINADGKLNINFFIKENLRQYFLQKASSFLHPYQLASQIATKMSECIATMEGTKPKMDLLTKTIWSLAKHLLHSQPLQSLSSSKFPCSELDSIDQLIARTVLDTTAQHPYIGMEELAYKVKGSLQAVHDLPHLSSIDKITCNVSALLADKLYATSFFSFSMEQKETLDRFISKHAFLYKGALQTRAIDLVRRIMALYTLVSQVPKHLEEKTLYLAVEATLSHTTIRPDLPQPLYAFISAELSLLGKKENIDEITSAIFHSYQEASHLPLISSEERDLLEVFIWKKFNETEGFLDKLPYKIGLKIEEEIAHILLDNPEQRFSSVVQKVVEFFKRVQELGDDKQWDRSQQKIHLLCLQNDLLCRCIRLPIDTPLGQIIQRKWHQEGPPSCPRSFLIEVCQEFLRKFPHLSLYTPQLNAKAKTLYKYLWFTQFSQNEESSLDRFLSWHIQFLKSEQQDPMQQLSKLEEICKNSLPLMPFDLKAAKRLLLSSQEEKQA